MKFYLPYTGQQRKIKRFAWYPMKVGHTIYWLEKLTLKQSYVRGYGWRTQYVMEED
jgi:hypothetical protein